MEPAAEAVCGREDHPNCQDRRRARGPLCLHLASHRKAAEEELQLWDLGDMVVQKETDSFE